jgi:23S rRNA pseudouridine2605 synthase
MRLNQYIALHTAISRRRADQLIKDSKVLVNDAPAKLGQSVTTTDKVAVNGLAIHPKTKFTTITLNKPAGYVVSRDGQGSKTIYDLLPQEFRDLKPIGRLDKNSSGLLLLTNDGELANKLTHPKYQKEKIYEVELDKQLKPEDKTKIEKGVMLEDGISKLKLEKINGKKLKIVMSEGRNRQIRRTFATLGYKVTKLHRTQLENHTINDLESGKFQLLKHPKLQ